MCILFTCCGRNKKCIGKPDRNIILPIFKKLVLKLASFNDSDISVVALSRNENISNAVVNDFLVVKSLIIGLNYCFWKLITSKSYKLNWWVLESVKWACFIWIIQFSFGNSVVNLFNDYGFIVSIASVFLRIYYYNWYFSGFLL